MRELLGSLLCLCVLASLPACALERLTLPGAGAPDDGGVAGTDDGGRGVVDAASIDATTPPVADAGDDDDATTTVDDAGTCTARCDGNVAITCAGPVEVPMDCGAAAVCMADGGGARCQPFVCTPATSRCSADGRAELACAESGLEESATDCARGCDPLTSACRPPAPCTRADDGTIATGMMRIDLCGTGNHHDHDRRTCAYGAGGEDALLRLTVDQPGRYTIDVRDAPGGNGVDPIVYLRRVCEDRETELGCDDDGGAAGRDSLLVVDLAAGEYFLVVDSYDDQPGGTDCGEVDLAVTRAP